MNIPSLVPKIHASGFKGVIAIAGGGAGAIDELTKYGGASTFLLEAPIIWAQKSFEKYIGRVPEKFVSELAARQLAMVSYQKGLKLEPEGKIIGVGVTCALAKADERIGRDHKVCISTQTADLTSVKSFALPHLGREAEEKFVSQLIIQVLAGGVEVLPYNKWLNEIDFSMLESSESGEADYGIKEVLHGRLNSYYPDGTTDLKTKAKKLLFPGSYNPFHQGHAEMADIASKHYGLPITYEISITNVDKAPLDYIDINNRMDQFKGNLVLTNAPLVVQKARLFPNSIFVCGVDSWVRIRDIKYYDNDPVKTALVLAEIKNLGCTFMVFPRMINGVVQQLEEDEFTFGLAVPSPIMPTHLDCSSTKIRAEASK